MHSRLLLLLATAVVVSAQPSIKTASVVNASGYQNRLAPDTVFVIFGSALGPADLQIASAPNYPDQLAGTSVTFTPSNGGNAVTARMVYTLATQVAGLLPSSIAPGTYAVRVSYNGTPSAPQNVTVVARSFGIAAANSAGSGPAQATIGNVNSGISLVRFTSGNVSFNGLKWTLTPAHPGDTLVFWGTGGGADTANDSGGTSGDQTSAGGFTVTVGGRTITPLYAGASSGYPGLWQINFTLPADIAANCFAQTHVTAGGESSNTVTLAIAPAGSNECSDPNLSAASLAKLDAGGQIVGGAFGLVHTDTVTSAGTTTQEIGSGAFFKWTAAHWATSAGLRPARGQCGVFDRVVAGGVDPGGPGATLDAGARLPLTGPGLAASAGFARGVSSSLGPIYGYTPAAALSTGGTYSLSGTGGADVGAFPAVTTRMPDSFTVTNLASLATVNHTKPLTISWTGSGFDHVLIDLSSLLVAAGGSRSVTVTCDAPAAPGSFTIPADIMGALPVSPNGGMGIYAQPNPGFFTANLTAGGQLDFGSFAAERGVSTSVAVQ